MRALVEAGTPVVSIFGKSWDLHVQARAGHHRRREPQAHLRNRAVPQGPRQGSGLRRRAFLRRLHRQSGLTPCARSKPRRRPAPTCCACATPTAARSPAGWSRSSREVRKRFDGVIGIHTHNDSDVAVANTIAAVEAGATHVQGCMNGYGERCGNANLASVIANLELKLGHTTIGPEKLAEPRAGVPLHRRTGQSAAAQRSAVRRPQRLRAQGRRARERRAEGFRHLRARHAGSRWATGSACW